MYNITILAQWSNDYSGTPHSELVATWAEVTHAINEHGGNLLDVNTMPCDDPTRFVGMTVYVSKSDSDKTFRQELLVTDANELHGGSWIMTSNAFN